MNDCRSALSVTREEDNKQQVFALMASMITFQGTNSNIATLSAIPDISSHHSRMVEREVVEGVVS